jgi:cbb3-type cytochrome oxidase cytochrome c subunit
MKSVMVFAGAIASILFCVAFMFRDDASDRGREVYVMQKCALCHSIAGIGGQKMPLDRVGSRLKSEDIRKWVKTPKAMKADSTMKAYPNLLEKDLTDLTAFLMTLK